MTELLATRDNRATADQPIENPLSGDTPTGLRHGLDITDTEEVILNEIIADATERGRETGRIEGMQTMHRIYTELLRISLLDPTGLRKLADNIRLAVMTGRGIGEEMTYEQQRITLAYLERELALRAINTTFIEDTSISGPTEP